MIELLTPPVGERAQAAADARLQHLGGADGHPRILCVDDNPGELDVLEEAIAIIDAAAQVETTTSGHLAIARLCGLGDPADGGLPDLLVIDIRMPLISGPDLLSGIRSQHELTGLRVVMISGAADDDERWRCRQLGALAVVDKPMDFAGYLNLARQLVNLARAGAGPAPAAGGDASAPTPASASE